MSARILIVEDDSAIRRLLVKILEREGLAVEVAGDGAEGLERILSGRFGVVILDLMLPRLSGYEVLAACAGALVPPPVFLVMTAFDRSARESLDPVLVTGVIAKPFDVEVVACMIREVAQAWTGTPPAASRTSTPPAPPEDQVIG